MLLYKGRQPIQLAHLLTKPEHSIINQSFSSKSGSRPQQSNSKQRVNGDGFGVGWYESEPDQESESGAAPCIFTSVTPAWNNMNLIRLAEKIKSPLVFAHVRGSNAGSVSESNCQPWQFGRLMFMHNGLIADFHLIKRKVQQSLSDEIFHSVNGNTDSEWAFAVFLSQLENPRRAEPFCHNVLKDALLKTIAQLNSWLQDAHRQQQQQQQQQRHNNHAADSSPIGMEPSFLNFAVTDGVSVVCSRYVNSSSPTVDAASMYFSSGSKFECYEPGRYRMIKTAAKRVDLVVIASEPLTFEEADWLKVPTNTVLVITSQMNVLMYPVEDQYQRRRDQRVISAATAETRNYTETDVADGRRRRREEVSIQTSPIAIAGRGDHSSVFSNSSNNSSGINTPSTPSMSSWLSSHFLPSSPSESSMSNVSSVLSDRGMSEYLKAEELLQGADSLHGQKRHHHHHHHGNSIISKGNNKSSSGAGGDCHDSDNDSEIEEDHRIFPIKRSLQSTVFS